MLPNQDHLRFVLEQVEGQVCFADLFSLSIIATKANLVYEHIKKTPEAYIGRRFSSDGLMLKKTEEVVQSFEDERNKLLLDFSESERQLILRLIGDIFPLLDAGGFSLYGATDTDAAGRVSAPQRLYIAFHYKTPVGYISDQEILQFISGGIDRKEFVARVLSGNADDRFFEMMQNYSSACKKNSYDVLASIYDGFLNSEQLLSSLEGNLGFITKDPYRQMNWLTNKIISESDNKLELIKLLIEREESVPLSSDILRKARDQIRGNVNDEPWFSEDQLKELEHNFQHIATRVLTRKAFINIHLESHIFYEFMRSSKEKASKFLSEILSSEGAVRVAQIIGYSGSDSTNGPYAKIDEISFSEVVDLKCLKEKVREIDVDSQPVHIQAILKSILDGKKYYLRDGGEG